MPYALGIDLGTDRTTAAVSRDDNRGDNRGDGRDARWSEPELVPLDPLDGSDRAGVASVLHLTDDHAVEVGVQALRQVATRPDRVAREFLYRIGDEVPLTLGGRHYPAEVLAAALIGWVVDRAEELEGAPASQLVVTHPAAWGTHRRAEFSAALREINLPELTLLPRPVAAAEAYAAGERVEVGDELAVYSLGAGRFEAAVLRRGSFGFELRAHAESAEVLGGSLFDDLLAEHALADLGDEPHPTALAALRDACVAAKERLSTAVAVTIPAPPRSGKATVLVNRTEFDELIRPVIEHTVGLLQRTIAGSEALRAVVLVGGSAQLPLVGELVSTAVRVRAVTMADPATALARGAALAAGRVAKPTVRAPAVAPAQGVTQHTDLMRLARPDSDVGVDEEDLVADVGPPPPRPPVEIDPLEPPARGLARLTRRAGRRGADVDELDRDRAWDFEDDEDLRDRRSHRRDGDDR